MSYVTLPEEYLETTVADMQPGDWGWVTNWTMIVDADRVCYIDGGATIDSTGGGTVTMKIIRRGDGFEVYPNPTYRWRAEVRAKELSGLIPVVKMHLTT